MPSTFIQHPRIKLKAVPEIGLSIFYVQKLQDFYQQELQNRGFWFESIKKLTPTTA